MSDTETKTREQELAEEFKNGIDADSVPALAARIAELEADRDRASDANGKLQETLAAETDRADKAEQALKTAKAKVSRGAAPAKARNIGAMKEGEGLTDRGVDGGGVPVRALSDAIDDAIADEKAVEIVFSDGKKELTQVPPVQAEGMVWEDRMQGKFLTQPVEIEGGPTGRPGFSIAGYALLIDGKQVAYTPRSDPLNIAAGTKVTLRDDIYFT